MKIICISGKARSGKDTLAEFLCNELDKDCTHSILVTHYADLLKYMCKTFFEWDGKKDRVGRTLLQHVGTDCVRANKPDFWVNFIADILELFPDQWDYVIIPDCRFPNEIDTLKEKGYDTTVVRTERIDFENGLDRSQSLHPSETSLDSYEFDYVAAASNLDELHEHAKDIVRKITGVSQ